MTARGPAAKSWSINWRSTGCATCSACRARAIWPRSTPFTTREIALTVCRHESGAAVMAEAVGKATGRPGICFVTRGPGATNASAGIHIARQDLHADDRVRRPGRRATCASARRSRNSTTARCSASIAKWATEIDDPARIPELVSRAFHTACNGRPGPVVIALPEDMLTERAMVPDASAVRAGGNLAGSDRHEPAAKTAVGRQDARSCWSGGSRWSEAACAALARFAERFALPVATTFRRQYLFDGLHPCYAGDLGIGPNPKLLARVKGADLVLLIGGRLSEMATQGYTLLDIPEPQMKLVHVHPGAEELGRVYHPHARHQRGADRVLLGAGRLAAAERDRLARRGGHRACRLSRLVGEGDAAAGRASISAKSSCGCATILRPTPSSPTAPAISPAGSTASTASANTPPMSAPTSGSMGYGFPAAVAMKLLHPGAQRGLRCRRRRFPDDGPGFRDRRSVQIAGHRRARRQRPLRHHPHASGARISRPRRRHRSCTIRISSPMRWRSAATAPWWRRPPISRRPSPPRKASGKPSIIHLKIDPEAISTFASISAIREKALAGGGGKSGTHRS